MRLTAILVLACSMGPGGVAFAEATASPSAGLGSSARAHFEAVRSLIDHDCRAPAERAYAEFVGARYADARWYEVGLGYRLAERFRSTATSTSMSASSSTASATATATP